VTEAVNQSEQWVYEICKESFLSVWSYVNPQGRNPGKELCDILVVFDPHVIVISVKEVQLSNSGDHSVNQKRWEKKAIEASIRQINGAIRWLNITDHVIKKDGSKGLPLPPLDRRIYHRIAVALGGQDKVYISPPSIPDKHLYHILDEQSFFLLLRHLDTISDFVEYLSSKEPFKSRAGIFISGGEENLLALYLHAGRKFPPKPSMLLLEGDLWVNLTKKPEFQAKLQEDKVSYIWDHLIETFCAGGFEGPN
jgi:hypothetical protein